MFWETVKICLSNKLILAQKMILKDDNDEILNNNINNNDTERLLNVFFCNIVSTLKYLNTENYQDPVIRMAMKCRVRFRILTMGENYAKSNLNIYLTLS